MALTNGKEHSKEMVDFDALGIEIDKEIDALFVPAGQTPAEVAAPSAPAMEQPAIAAAAPVPPASALSNGLSMGALEVEIDKEIDSLFVPAPQMMPKDAKLPVLTLEQTAAEEATTPPADTPRNGLDMGALEVQIDNEIDALFVPAPKTTPEAPEPTIQKMEAPHDEETLTATPADTPRKEFDVGALEVQIDDGIDALFVPAVKPVPAAPVGPDTDRTAVHTELPELVLESETLKPAATAQQRPSVPAGDILDRDEIPISAVYTSKPRISALVEAFNAAYLSLDWDLSPENLGKLRTALKDLEPFTDRAPGSAPIVKILKSVLSRLRMNPQSIDPALLEMIRDSQGLLAHMLLMDGEPGPQEKRRIKGIIERFQVMMGKAPREKAAQSAPPVAEEPAGPAQTETMPEGCSLRELRFWMKGVGSSLHEALAGTDAELRRLRQLEGTLSKTRALAPLVDRLTDIRNGVERRMKILKEEHSEWQSRIGWVETLERAGSYPPSPQQEHAADAALPVTAEPVEPAQELRKEDVCLFNLSGKPFALLSAHVVKVQQISHRKAEKILKRGYASLVDFKPFFGSLKSGILGNWTSVSRKDLQSYKFEPLCSGPFDKTESHNAILVSSGDKHGIVIADPGGTEFHTKVEITVEPGSCRQAFAAIASEAGKGVPVLDLDRVFDEKTWTP